MSVENFSNELFGKKVTANQIYKFFRSKGLYPTQKREGSDRVRCYLGIKFKDEPEQWGMY